MSFSARYVAIGLLLAAAALPCRAEAPAVGAQLPELTLHDGEGTAVALDSLLAEHYTVLVLGCLTTPRFLQNVAEMEAVAERLMHLDEARRRLSSSGIPWLADGMDNAFKAALGNVENAELLIGPDGRLLTHRAWSDPQALREDLARIVGAVEEPTQVDDLDLELSAPTEVVAEGIVPRVEVAEAMRPLIVAPLVDKEKRQPYYVKLRAEADPGLLEEGRGTLYLGFHLDPLHEVHWNNRKLPLSFELGLPRGTSAEPSGGRATEIEADADADPREFLVRIEADDINAPIELTVNYVACDNTKDSCVPVSQRYRIRLEEDPFGGRVLGRGGRAGGAIAQRSSRRGPKAGARGSLVQRFMRLDVDGNGKIEPHEVPETMKPRIDRMDVDGDGIVDEDEIRATLDAMIQRRRER